MCDNLCNKINAIAKFEKVSLEQYKKDVKKLYPNKFSDTEIEKIYDNIKLPQRATSGSAGYDFYAPFDISIDHADACIIPTGIRCRINYGWFLDINPRSGHGFKHGIHLANTRGIIDSDYYNADNEGHILVKLVNDSVVGIISELETFSVETGKAFCQGIFTVYGVTVDDLPSSEHRTGGFGSTSK